MIALSIGTTLSLERRIGPLMVADLLLLTLFAVPWLLSPWPIGVDLPQHAAQIHLLEQALSGAADLEVAWYAPNSLVYWPLAATVSLFGPLAGTKVMSWLLLTAGGMLSLRFCRQRGTRLGFAVVAAAFAFNSNLYWGFLPFQLGWVVFLGWLMMMLSERANSPGWLFGLAVLNLVLLSAHSLWFAAAAVAGVAMLIARPSAWRQRIVRGLMALPAAVLAAWWAPQLEAQRVALRFDVSARWVNALEVRFTPGYFTSAALGEVHGSYLLVAVIAVIVALLVLSQMRPDGVAVADAVDRESLVLGTLFITAVFVLPDIYMNATDFARRWAPYGCALLAMGGIAELVPGWRTWKVELPRAVSFVSVVPLIVVVVWTTLAWRDVSSRELAGLEESLEAIGEFEEPRTMGLNFVKHSRHVGGLPFLQQFAWSQAMHGGALNFSFTEHGSGLVRDPEPTPKPWMPGLEWQPDRFRPDDLRYFDVLLVGGRAEEHEPFEESDRLELLTEPQLWRAYRVK